MKHKRDKREDSQRRIMRRGCHILKGGTLRMEAVMGKRSRGCLPVAHARTDGWLKYTGRQIIWRDLFLPSPPRYFYVDHCKLQLLANQSIHLSWNLLRQTQSPVRRNWKMRQRKEQKKKERNDSINTWPGSRRNHRARQRMISQSGRIVLIKSWGSLLNI